MTPAPLSISAVERETRLSKDVLRVWERRYGFPVPERDANGERCYPVEQVERLRLMKRLMDQGLRPGRLARLPAEQLAQLTRAAPQDTADAAGLQAVEAPAIEALLDTLKHDPGAFHDAMRHHLARLGLERFVVQVAAPLTTAVGARWEDGSFDVFDEHFYTEATARLLRHAIGALPAAAADAGAGRSRAARILLTTLPGEAHALGLAMVEAMLALDGACCIALGTETPPSSIARAAATHRADIVALSFSQAYPRRQAVAGLQQLRQLLPAGTALWAGGAGVAPIGRGAVPPGVRLLPTLDSGREALAAWRILHGAGVESAAG